MVDTAEYLRGDEELLCSLLVQASTPFVVNGVLDECGLIEHIAQTVALGSGYLDWQLGKPPTVGYIASLDNLTFTRRPAMDERVTTHVQVIQRLGTLRLAEVESRVGEEVVAHGKIKVYEVAE